MNAKSLAQAFTLSNTKAPSNKESLTYRIEFPIDGAFIVLIKLR